MMSVLVPFDSKHITMIFIKKQNFDQAGLSPIPVVTTVLKDTFTAVSTERITSEIAV